MIDNFVVSFMNWYYVNDQSDPSIIKVSLSDAIHRLGLTRVKFTYFRGKYYANATWLLIYLGAKATMQQGVRICYEPSCLSQSERQGASKSGNCLHEASD